MYYKCCPGFEGFVPSGADEEATEVVDAAENSVLCLPPIPTPTQEPEPERK